MFEYEPIIGIYFLPEALETSLIVLTHLVWIITEEQK